MSKMLIIYDGDCPICCAKRDFLERRDRRGALEFSNVRKPGFEPPVPGLNLQSLETEIHSISHDGKVLRGMDVIREAYKAIGIGWLAAPTGWPLLRPLFDWIYAKVAGNRLKISKALGISKR